MRNVVPLARMVVNNAPDRVGAVLALIDLIETTSSFLNVTERYRISDRLRNLADRAERIDPADHRLMRTNFGDV